MTLREKGAHGDARARLGLCGPGKRNAPLKFTSVTKLQKSSMILDARGANAALPLCRLISPTPGPGLGFPQIIFYVFTYTNVHTKT